MGGDAQEEKKKSDAERRARLSQALRQNLRRRKEQSRERSSETAGDAEFDRNS